jgi:integrase
MKLGPHYSDSGFIFAAPDGLPVDFKAATRRRFGKLTASAEVVKIRPYDLRHSCASLLLAGGVHPKVVSERLGHSTITLTMDTYSHVLPTMQEDATVMLGRLLTRG